MINWIYSQIVTGIINFPKTFQSNSILVSISSSVVPTLRRVGTLHVEILIDGEFFTAQRIKVEFGNSLISIPFSSYRLSFKPVDSLLTIYQNTSIKITEFKANMQVIPASSNSPQVGEDSFESFVPTDGTDPSPVFQIVPAFRRRAIRITNKTTAGMYLKSGVAGGSQPLVAADPFTFVPSGASYSSEDYSGEINGVMDGVFLDGGLIIVSQSPYII